MRRLAVNPAPCTGCLCCQSVCAQNRTGDQDRRASAFQVELDLFGGLHSHVYCRQCHPAQCAAACSSGAITRNGIEESWTVDPDTCTRCGTCVDACPFGAMGWHPVDGPVKCDLCGGEPLCASACMFGVIRFLDVSDSEFGFNGMPPGEQDPTLGRGSVGGS